MELDWMYHIGEDEVWTSCRYNTKEEAIEALKFERQDDHYEGNENCYVGRIEWFVPTVNAWHIMDSISDDAWDECGECSEGAYDNIPYNIMEELNDELVNVFNDWLKRHELNEKCGRIVEIEEIPWEVQHENS